MANTEERLDRHLTAADELKRMILWWHKDRYKFWMRDRIRLIDVLITLEMAIYQEED